MRSWVAARADSSRVMRRPVAAPPAWTIRRARVAALQPEREVAAAIGVEGHAQRLELAHARRATPRRARARRSHGPRPRPGRERVVRVQVRRVALGERGGDPALGPEAGGLGQRRAAHERHARGQLRGHERGEQAGGAGADDGDVGAQERFGRGLHGAAVRYRRACRSSSPTPPRSSTTPASGIPSGRIGSARSRPSSASATGSAASAARRRAAELEQLLAVHPREHVEAVRELSARGGAFDLDTPTSARAPGRRRSTPPAARARWWRRCWAAASGSASRRCGRPATTASASGRWASACSRTSPWPRATRSTRWAWSGCCARLGRAPRQRHERDLPRVARGALREHPPVPVLSRHRAARRRGLRRGRGLLAQPAGAGRRGRGRVLRRWWSTWCCRRRAQFEPELVLVSAGYDAHRDDPVGGCALETSSFAELTRQVLTLGVPVGACSRAATTSTRSPPGWRRRWRRSPTAASRALTRAEPGDRARRRWSAATGS